MSWRVMAFAVLALPFAACASPPPTGAVPLPPPPPSIAASASAPALKAAPARIRADLDRVTQKEASVVAAPGADAETIARVRALDRAVRYALDELEADGGRHVTPNAVARAQRAMRELQQHLNDFQAEEKAP